MYTVVHTRWAMGAEERERAKDVRLIIAALQPRNESKFLRLLWLILFSFRFHVFLVSVNRLNDENYFVLFTLLWLPDSIRHGHFVVFMLSVCALERAGGGIWDGGGGAICMLPILSHTTSMANRNKKSTNDSMRMTVRDLELFSRLQQYGLAYCMLAQHRKNFDLNYLHKEIFRSL